MVTAPHRMLSGKIITLQAKRHLICLTRITFFFLQEPSPPQKIERILYERNGHLPRTGGTTIESSEHLDDAHNYENMLKLHMFTTLEYSMLTINRLYNFHLI